MISLIHNQSCWCIYVSFLLHRSFELLRSLAQSKTGGTTCVPSGLRLRSARLIYILVTLLVTMLNAPMRQTTSTAVKAHCILAAWHWNRPCNLCHLFFLNIKF